MCVLDYKACNGTYTGYRMPLVFTNAALFLSFFLLAENKRHQCEIVCAERQASHGL